MTYYYYKLISINHHGGSFCRCRGCIRYIGNRGNTNNDGLTYYYYY